MSYPRSSENNENNVLLRTQINKNIPCIPSTITLQKAMAFSTT